MGQPKTKQQNVFPSAILNVPLMLLKLILLGLAHDDADHFRLC